MTHMQAAHCFAAARPSVLLALNRLAQRLERALLSLGDVGHAETELRAIADGLVDAVEQAPDVALASIYLNQIAGLYAVRHCIEAAIVAALLARAMDKPQAATATIVAAALTMNAGMVRLTEVFQLKDGALSDEERAAVHRHPLQGAELLRRAGVCDEQWLDCVLMHHELDDGSGYPNGRSGVDIPDCARLVGMADRYCAMVSARNYRRSLLAPVALGKLCAECGDPQLASHFRQQLGTHPPGTLVRLRNREIGVVSSRPGLDGAAGVHALLDREGIPLAQPLQRSTGEPDHAIDMVLHEDEAGLRFSMRQVWGDAAAV